MVNFEHLKKVKNCLSQIIKKYIDITCSIMLFMTLFYTWFYIEQVVIINIICILMEVYVLYYGGKMLPKWSMLNIMIAFWRIVFIMN